MILEWLEAKLTPSSALARRFNLVYHSVALKHRYRRCRLSWQSHIQNCHRVINQAVAQTSRQQHLVILGSAHLHEIPKRILEKDFRKVTLVDLVHPLSVRRWARAHSHIELVEQDVTGFLARLDEFKDSEVLLQAVEQTASSFHYAADLIISSNLISQLHLIAIDHLAKRKILATEDFNDRLGHAFSQQHLRALTACEGSILIYGDRETIYRDTAQQITYRGSFPVDFTGFHFLNKWTWNIAPLGEFSKRESIEMVVEAYNRKS